MVQGKKLMQDISRERVRERKIDMEEDEQDEQEQKGFIERQQKTPIGLF